MEDSDEEVAPRLCMYIYICICTYIYLVIYYNYRHVHICVCVYTYTITHWACNINFRTPGGCTLRGSRTPDPRSKVPKYGVFGVSILGIVSMVLGRYLAFGYLDP